MRWSHTSILVWFLLFIQVGPRESDVRCRSFRSSTIKMNLLLVFCMVQAMTLKCYLKECSFPVTILAQNAFSVSKKVLALLVTSINFSQIQSYRPSFPLSGHRQLHNPQSSYLSVPTPLPPLPSSHSLQW